MGRQLTFVASTTVSPTVSLIPLDDVPEEIKREVEETYAALKTNPAGRIRATFDTKEEMAQYISQVTAYCRQRPTGEIRFRKSPTRNLPDNVMDFRITDLKTESEKETEEIRKAVKIANAPAKETPAKATSRRK